MATLTKTIIALNFLQTTSDIIDMAEIKMLSIVIPVYCEEKNIIHVYERLENITRKIDGYDWEYVFVNDGSTDGSYAELQKLSSMDKNVKVINFSRNFGKEVALSAGVEFASGEAVITIDADLQHPPELIPLMVEKWLQGKEVVVGLRKSIKGQPLLRHAGSYLYHGIMNKISNMDNIAGSTDFRLIDRKVADVFRTMKERSRIYRGIVDWIGFERDYIEFDAGNRTNGKSVYAYKSLIELAINSITSFSLFPLKVAGMIGLLITLFSFVLMVIMYSSHFLLGSKMFSPLALVVVSNTFLIGIVLVSLGLIALYIGNIHSEVAGRPLYIVKNKLNF